MMEHTTDRLFWTLSAIIVAALLLTLSAKAFPKATQQAIAPITGLMKQADKATSGINLNAGSIESSDTNSGNTTDTSNSDGSNNMGGVTNSTGPDDGLIGQVQQQNDQSTRANMSLANYQVQLNTATSQISSLQQQLQAIQNNPTNSSVSAQAITDLSSRLQALNATVSSNQDTFQNQINQVLQTSNDKTSAIQSIIQTIQNGQKTNSDNISSLQNNANQVNNTLNNTIANQSNIANITDMDQLTTPGVYNLNGNNNIKNLPNNSDPWDNVVVTVSNKIVTQMIQNKTHLMWRIISQNQSWPDNPWQETVNATDLSAITNQLTQMQQAITSLQQNTLQYKPNPADGTSLRDITQPGIYVLSGNPAAHNWGDIPSGTTGWYNLLVVISGVAKPTDPDSLTKYDNGNEPNVVHQMFIGGGYSWDTSTLKERTFHVNGNQASQSDYNWQVAGNDNNTLSLKGDVSGVDYNNLTTTGIYSTKGAPAPNSSPTGDWYRTLEVINNQNGIIIQRETTQDNNSQSDGQQIMWQRIRVNGVWQGWVLLNSDNKSKVFNNGDNLLDIYYQPDGSYHVQNDQTNGPSNGFSGYGIITKKQIGGDIVVTLYDSNGAIYSNTYGYGMWRGWVTATPNASISINNGDDLNNYTKSGNYASFNTNVKNSPYSYTCWFQLSVQQGGGFTTQTLTSSWGQVWTRTLSGWPQVWTGWNQTNNGQ